MADIPNRIAIVYDWAVKWGGAERVLLEIKELFPEADLFTSVYDKKNATWAKSFITIKTSFIQHLPFSKSHHELYPLLTPLAFEEFNFSNYDLVISVSSADAKGIITPPEVLHICYCLTPTRYLWSHENEYKKNLSKLFHPLFKYLKYWDQIASQRPDRYIAISNTVQSRIKKYYDKDSVVIYPPVNIPNIRNSKFEIRNYYLWVGRFVPYKRPLEIIKVFNDLNLPLTMIGIGSELDKAKKIAKENVTFLGSVSDEKLYEFYSKAVALVAFHEEDFGLVAVEAQTMGVPVIGLNKGGISETVVDGVTGILDSNLYHAIDRFKKTKFNSKTIITHAEKYSQKRFRKEFGKLISDIWIRHQSTRSF